MLKDFDHCFVSEKIGVDKPDVRFFQRCLEQLPGIRAEECMIVGDSLSSDILGGNNAGIITCWYNPDHKLLQEGVRIDHEITDLHEIYNLI